MSHSRGRGRSRNAAQRDGYKDFVPDDFVADYDTRHTSFEEMEVTENLLRGIYQYGFKSPSEIQSLAIVPMLKGNDVIAQAQSGTGKTGAFSIGTLSRIDESAATTQAIILSPTRELTEQTYNFMKEIAARTNITIELFKGGTSQSEDEKKASALPQVAVCTPGKAAKLIQTGHLRVDNIKLCVIDEADQLLDENFDAEISSIFQFLSPEVQLCFFSATFSGNIYNRIKGIFEGKGTKPVKILVKAEKLTLEGIKQYFVSVDDQYKARCLLDIYSKLIVARGVIFANTKDTVKSLSETFAKEGFVVSAIHSGLEQTERDNIMRQFRLGATRCLVGTDLIARGIDVQQITLVINYELPVNKEQYIHRIGRSARYGRKGVAINLVSSEEISRLEAIRSFYTTQIDELPGDFARIVQEAAE